MLNLQRLLRMVIAAICAIVTVAVGCNDIGYVVAMDGPNEAFPVGSDELGLEILDNSSHDLALPPANPATKRFVWGGHTIRVLSKYHVGYDLSVMTTTGGSNSERDNRLMHGESSGATIRSTDGGALSNNTWGMTTTLPVDENSGWRGFSNDDVMQILRENRGELSQSKEPDVSETDVYYGVKIDWSTPADDYSTTVRYTLSARIPDTPAVLRLSQNKYRIGDDDDNRTIELTGVRFDRVTAVGVDFNGNYRIDDNEKCTNWRRANGQSTNEATCELPVYNSNSASADLAPGADNMGGQFNLLVQDNTKDGGRVVPSGQQIIYYYQPQIGDVEVLNSEDGAMKIKESVGVIDMVSTADASMVLTDDGDVYLWGNTLLSDTSGVERFGQTLAPMIVTDFPSLVHADRIVDIAAYGRSYYAVSHQGYLYAWGDNSAEQLPLQDNQISWFSKPIQSSYYSQKQNGHKRFARQVTAGNQFGITLNTLESGQLMSSWGRNDMRQLGQDNTNSTYVPGEVVQDHQYRPVVGESYGYIVTGQDHTLALTSYGRVLSWGAYGNTSGGDNRLGFKTENDAGHPHDITYNDDDKDKNYLWAAYHDKGQTFIDIAAGNNFSMALAQGPEGDSNTYLYTFGSNDMGQLGNGGGTSDHRAYDISGQFKLDNGDKIIGITASGESAAAWTTGGQLYVWGDNSGGKLGLVGGSIINTPRAVLSEYRIDNVSLGAVNYARTTDGRVIAWGGSCGGGFLRGGSGDITNWLTNPSYLVRVTGKNLSLNGTEIWIDFNNNELMEDAERPLAVSCSGDSCYLQVATTAINLNDIDGVAKYSVCAAVAPGTNHAGVGCDGAQVEVKKELANSVERTVVNKLAIPKQAKAIDESDDPVELEGVGTDEEATETDESDDGVGESGDAEASEDNGSVPGRPVDANDNNPKDDELETPDSEPGDADQGNDSANNGDNSDNGNSSGNCNDSSNAEVSGGEACVDGGDDTDNCDGGQKVAPDDSDDGECGSDTSPNVNSTPNDKVANEVDLLGDVGSGAQVQLVDGRRKGCLNGVSRVNIDNQP